MKKAKGKAEALPAMLGGTVGKGTADAKGMGTGAKRRVRQQQELPGNHRTGELAGHLIL